MFGSNAGNLKKKYGMHFIGLSILLVNLTGDHIFNKVDYLKLAILYFSIVCFFVFFCHRFYRNHIFSCFIVTSVFAFFPTIATFWGWLVDPHQYLQNSYFEWFSKAILAVWFGLCVCVIRYESDQLRALGYWLVGILLFVSFIALLQSFGLQPELRFGLSFYERFVLDVNPVYAGPLERVSSTFGNPNYFSAFLIVVLPVAIAQFLVLYEDPSKKNNSLSVIVVLVSIIFSMYALPMAGTRSALVALFGALSIFLMLIMRIRSRYRFFAFSIFFIIFFVGFIIVFSHSELLSRFSKILELSAWSPRLTAWNVAWESIKDAPLLGRGAGASYSLFFEYAPADWRLFYGGRSFNHPHNQILEVLQEGGVLGLCVYVIFWGSIFYLCFKIIFFHKESSSQLYALGIFSGLLAYHVHSLVSVAERMVVVNVLAYSLAAWLVAIAHRYNLLPRLVTSCVYELKEWLEKFQINRVFMASLLMSLLGGSGIWFYQFLNYQNNLVQFKAGLISDDTFFDRAGSSGDAYLLDEAIRRAIDLQENTLANKFSNKLHTVFPYYREANYFSALSKFRLGDIDDARKNLDLALEKDAYYLYSLHLSAAMALRSENEQAFFHALAALFHRRACQKKLIDCSDEKLRWFVDSDSPGLMNLEVSKEGLVVVFSANMMMKILLFFDHPKNEEYTRQHIISLAHLIGQQRFFLPVGQARIDENNVNLGIDELSLLKKFINGSKALELVKAESSNSEYRMSKPLYEQIHIFRQWRRAKQKKIDDLVWHQSQYHDALMSKMDLAAFMRRREVLNNFASDLFTIIDLTNENFSRSQ